MRFQKRALVVGGGISGTVAAIALHEAGLDPVVTEAFDVGADGVGAFLTLAPNGVRGLRLLEVEARALAGGFETPRFEISLGDGRVLAEMPAGSADGSTWTLRRSDLYLGLRGEAEARGIPVDYGKRLVDARRTAQGVVARFADGTEIEADLLVGADGIHSRVRSILDARAPALRYLGLLNTGGFARGVEVPGPAGTVHFVFGKRCFLGWVKHPSGEVWWFANPGRPKEPSGAELARVVPAEWRAELLDLLSPDAPPAAAIVQATERIIGPWPTHDLPTVRVWRRERMVIIGDAAHAASPSSGQGASMAIEDGIVLARCLRDAAGVDEGLAAYEQSRRRRVERIVAQGRRNGSGKTPGPFGRAVRDVMFRLVFPRIDFAGAMAWIHDHRIDWEAPARAA
jgi:2-polyprenyl-6-methoxyphenol hydroxylase-like FAD-dependent oxidoreductase